MVILEKLPSWWPSPNVFVLLLVVVLVSAVVVGFAGNWMENLVLLIVLP